MNIVKISDNNNNLQPLHNNPQLDWMNPKEGDPLPTMKFGYSKIEDKSVSYTY